MKKIALITACFAMFITAAIAQEPIKPIKESNKQSLTYSTRTKAYKTVSKNKGQRAVLKKKPVEKYVHR